MNVKDLMTHAPAVCTTTDHASRAAQIMWDKDCGVVPVIDGTGRLAGVVTDRDLCMAAYTRGVALHDIPVERVMSRKLTTIGPDASLEDALELLAGRAVRRLPVVAADGRLVGILSMADFVRAGTRSTARRKLKAEDLLDALAGVSQPRPVAHVAPPSKSEERELAARTIVPAPKRTKTGASPKPARRR
jgi:CBS domain-containing protein